MKHWWGPKGFTVLSSKMDLRVGGSYHYGMKAPNGAAMWGLFKYREIVPQEKLVFINSFSDEQGRHHPSSRQRDLAAYICSRSSPSRMRPAARPNSP